MSVGQRIVSLRKKQGLTQAALAKAAALSASAIAMYETDRRTPDARSIAKLAAALGVADAVLSHGPTTSEDESVRQGTVDEPDNGTTQLTLTLEEARVILFLRMNPQAMSFIQTYITASHQRRTQLEKAWRLINEFQ